MRFVSPAGGSFHGLPLELRWTARREAVSYAVFVDRAPVRVGERIPEAGIDVLAATGPDARLVRLAGAAASETRDHHLVVVTVDGRGRRLGETAAVVDVRIDPIATDVPEVGG